MIETYLKKLISFHTLSHNHTENKRALSWLENQVRSLPVHTKKFTFNKFPSLIITTQKTKTPKVWLAAHIDVVNGPKELFQAKMKNGKLYGRGAADMKFAIACYLKLLKELKSNLSKLNFGLIINTDEEIGGANSIPKLLEKGYISKVCLLPDGGRDWQIETEAKGVWHFLAESKGKSAHGSRPWEGENALENLIIFLNNLLEKFPADNAARDHYHNTINIGQIQGGEAANKTPDYASALIDIRHTTETTKRELRAITQSAKKNLPKIKITTLASGNNFKNNPKNQHVKLFSEIAKEKFNIKTKALKSHGSSDGRFFADKKIPTIITRPHCGGHHSNNEWISLNDLNKFYEVTKEWVIRTSKI